MNRVFILLLPFLISILFSVSAFGKEKVLDLGAIEIQGEVRRPNVQLVYSKKKHFKKTLAVIAQDELRAFEQELLKPARKARANLTQED